jgi:hypothetical protein
MNLLERYLQAVGKYLPKARRDDIIAELRANILSQMEDREEELGLPMTDEERAEMLRHHGNPAIVAGRYREQNFGLAFGRQLIGPELFPVYRTVLLMNLAITAFIVAILMPILGRTLGVPATLGRFILPLFLQFVAVTLIFILLDLGKGHYANQWDPGELPPLKKGGDDGPNAQSIFGFIIVAISTLWLALIPHWPFLLLGPAAGYLQSLPVKFMPQWLGFYWAVISLLCAQLLLQAFNLFRRVPSRQRQVLDVIFRGVGFAIGLVLLLAGPDYVIAENSSTDMKNLTHWASLNFLVSLVVFLAISAWGFGRRVVLLIRQRNQMLPARQY